MSGAVAVILQLCRDTLEKSQQIENSRMETDIDFSGSNEWKNAETAPTFYW